MDLSIKRSCRSNGCVDKLAVDKLEADKPAVDKPGVDKLAVDKPSNFRKFCLFDCKKYRNLLSKNFSYIKYEQ